MSFNVQKNFGISDNTTSLYVVNLCSKNRAFDNVIILHYIPAKHPTVLLSRKVAIKLVLAKRVFCFVRVLSYTRPLYESFKPLLKGYSEGMKWGDTKSACYVLNAWQRHFIILAREASSSKN